IIERHSRDVIKYYEGIPCQSVGEALISATSTLGIERSQRASEEAVRRGYISQSEKDKIGKELGRDQETQQHASSR
ncbi:MAG: hypothetical protein ACI38Z_00505, partial [Parafannyhessea sp.]|uniref:hypothetical protein n=1 Tax=Parafannyhessea sp. TaxID=2847324 RepID=UPI003F0F5D83